MERGREWSKIKKNTDSRLWRWFTADIKSAFRRLHHYTLKTELNMYFWLRQERHSPNTTKELVSINTIENKKVSIWENNDTKRHKETKKKAPHRQSEESQWQMSDKNVGRNFKRMRAGSQKVWLCSSVTWSKTLSASHHQLSRLPSLRISNPESIRKTHTFTEMEWQSHDSPSCIRFQNCCYKTTCVHWLHNTMKYVQISVAYNFGYIETIHKRMSGRMQHVLPIKQS
jgi:hypothetical protein